MDEWLVYITVKSRAVSPQCCVYSTTVCVSVCTCMCSRLCYTLLCVDIFAEYISVRVFLSQHQFSAPALHMSNRADDETKNTT